MQYSNDEVDAHIRRSNFRRSVFLIPAGVAVALFGLAYWAVAAQYWSRGELFGSAMVALFAAFFMSVRARRRWLKMPDGSYSFIHTDAPYTGLHSAVEPDTYLAEYSIPFWKKMITLLIGVVLIGVVAVLAIVGTQQRIAVVLIQLFSGGHFLYIGIRQLMDKDPKLRIARTGLWTKRLGFVHWDDINYAEVVEDNTGDSKTHYLEIRLKGTLHEQTSQPDQRLPLSSIQNSDEIETVINDAILSFNSSKKSPGS